MEKTREIKKLLKQYGAGVIENPKFGGAVNILSRDYWKKCKKYGDPDGYQIYVTLEQSIEIMKKEESKNRYYCYFEYLPTLLVDYLESEVGKEKTEILHKDTLKL